jgi:hypothetical protein
VTAPHQCRLEQAVGVACACPESACPFWEPGGAVLAGRCAFEQLDLAGRPEIAAELLQIRAVLELAETADAERRARSRFYRLLNESRDD